jgi:hypothetical protein
MGEDKDTGAGDEDEETEASAGIRGALAFQNSRGWYLGRVERLGPDGGEGGAGEGETEGVGGSLDGRGTVGADGVGVPDVGTSVEDGPAGGDEGGSAGRLSSAPL